MLPDEVSDREIQEADGVAFEDETGQIIKDLPRFERDIGEEVDPSKRTLTQVRLTISDPSDQTKVDEIVSRVRRLREGE